MDSHFHNRFVGVRVYPGSCRDQIGHCYKAGISPRCCIVLVGLGSCLHWRGALVLHTFAGIWLGGCPWRAGRAGQGVSVGLHSLALSIFGRGLRGLAIFRF